MTTQAQIEANRQNAQLSTGPTTAAGKRKSSQNAFRHGLRSTVDVAPDEDQSEFNRHRKSLLDELAPVGVMESFYAERIVTLTWHLARATRLQSDTFDAMAIKMKPKIIEMPEDFRYSNIKEFQDLGMTHREFREIRSTEGVDGLRSHVEKLIEELQWHAQVEAAREAHRIWDNSLANLVNGDFSNGHVIAGLSLYERRIEQSLLKTRQALDELQTRRLALEEKRQAADPQASSLKPQAHEVPQASSLKPQASLYNSSPPQGEVAAQAAGGVPGLPSASSGAKGISPNEPNPDPSQTANPHNNNDLPQSEHSCAARTNSCAARRIVREAS